MKKKYHITERHLCNKMIETKFKEIIDFHATKYVMSVQIIEKK